MIHEKFDWYTFNLFKYENQITIFTTVDMARESTWAVVSLC